MEQKEFTIESISNTLRPMKLQPTEVLALYYTQGFENLEKAKTTIDFILEHCEVNIENKWFPVKEKGKDIYMPINLGSNIKAINEIFMYFIEEILGKVF